MRRWTPLFAHASQLLQIVALFFPLPKVVSSSHTALSLASGSFVHSWSFRLAARALSTTCALECPARIKRPGEGADDQPAWVSPVRTSSRNAFIVLGDPSMWKTLLDIGLPLGLGVQLPSQCMEGATSTNGCLLSASCWASGNVWLCT